jgi:hypothetical protein
LLDDVRQCWLDERFNRHVVAAAPKSESGEKADPKG